MRSNFGKVFIAEMKTQRQYLYLSKSSSQEAIPSQLLKLHTDLFNIPLRGLLNLHADESKFSDDLKLDDVSALFQKG